MACRAGAASPRTTTRRRRPGTRSAPCRRSGPARAESPAVRTEPIGSIPRPPALIDGVAGDERAALYGAAVRDTIARMEETGSPVVTGGEQRKRSFATYPVAELQSRGPDGVVIPFADGHSRQLPHRAAGRFRYATYAG